MKHMQKLQSALDQMSVAKGPDAVRVMVLLASDAA